MGFVIRFAVLACAATRGVLGNKILVLHGGGMSAPSISFPDIISRLETEGFTFEHAQGQYSSGTGGWLWIPDPPSKSNPSTDPNYAADSVSYIDGLVANANPPFTGIMGYSQGSAFTGYYVTQKPNAFQFAMMFCGYVPSTHLGLTGAMNDAVGSSGTTPLTTNAPSPSQLPALIFSGANDFIITPAMTDEQAYYFAPSTSERVESTTAAHEPPPDSDATFETVIQWAVGQMTSGSGTNNAGTTNGAGTANSVGTTNNAGPTTTLDDAASDAGTNDAGTTNGAGTANSVGTTNNVGPTTTLDDAASDATREQFKIFAPAFAAFLAALPQTFAQ